MQTASDSPGSVQPHHRHCGQGQLPLSEETSGEVKRIRVGKGLVIATGGFAGGLRFRMQQAPYMDATLDTTNLPGATAESLHALLRAGATPVQLDQIQLGPWASPDEKGLAWPRSFFSRSASPTASWWISALATGL